MTIEKDTLAPAEAGLCCIIPPYVLDHLVQSSDSKIRQIAVDAIANASAVRAVRSTLAMMPGWAAVPSPAARRHRLVYDVKNGGFNDLLNWNFTPSETCTQLSRKRAQVERELEERKRE
jgi:hypothetical protein